jgi:hypothetical protein
MVGHDWGDATVGPSAGHFTADFVTGPFRFEARPGTGHFVTDQAPAVTRGLLSHLPAIGDILSAVGPQRSGLEPGRNPSR